MAAAFTAISGFIDVGINAISSVVSDFGDIFVTAGSGLTDFAAVSPLEFGVGIDDLASFGAYEQVGSLAGNSSWFNAFNAGDIIDSAGSVFDSSGFFPANASDFGGFSNFVASAGDVFDTSGFIPISDFGGFSDFVSSAGDVFDNSGFFPVSPSEFGGIGDFVSSAGDVFDNSGFFPVSPSEFGGIGDFVSSAGSVFDNGGFIPVNPSDFGAVISSAGGVADSGFLSSFKLPSLSDIKSVAGQVQTDFGGFLKDVQGATREFQKIAPLVNVASSALGIQNPISQIVQPLSLVTGVAGAAAGVAGTVAGIGNARPLSSPGTVSSIGAGISGFRELSSAETNLLLGQAGVSPGLVNFFVDPGVRGSINANYNSAVEIRNQLAPVLDRFQIQANGAELAIDQENRNIIFYQSQLDNPELTTEERADIEARIVTSYDNIAINQEILDDTVPLIQSTSEEIFRAQQLITATNDRTLTTAAAVTGLPVDQFRTIYNPTTRTWSVFDTITNTTVQTGLSEQQALTAQQDLNIDSGLSLNTSTVADLGDLGEIVVTASRLPTEAEVTTEQNAVTTALTNVARDQQTLRNQRNTKAQSSDWRVKLSLAPNSTYLYNAGNPGLLNPLKNTNGVIFPYTPTIETAYKANYDTYDLTHSNYRGYFYKNSYVDAVNLRATFTAQDTNEANYLLAVIHFFRSVTKMFYGQNTDQRGAPPPLVYIKGYGDFQFNNHPCLVSQFNYTLPPDVDYIRAQSTLNNNTNLQLARLRNTIANNPLAYATRRVLNSGLLPGALDFRPPIVNNLDIGNPTYVPTKMEISISLLPIQSRQQVSKNFSIGGFADGNLLRGGFW